MFPKNTWCFWKMFLVSQSFWITYSGLLRSGSPHYSETWPKPKKRRMGSARCALPVKRGGAPIELGKPQGIWSSEIGRFSLGCQMGHVLKKSPHRVGGLPPPQKTLGVNTKWVFFLKFFFDV